MKTDGADTITEEKSMRFRDIRKNSLFFECLEIRLHKQIKKFVVELSKDYFNKKKTALMELVKSDVQAAVAEFNRLGNIPAYPAVVKQLNNIRKGIVYSGIINNIAIDEQALIINTELKEYEPFAELPILEPVRYDQDKKYLCQSWQGFLQQLIINANLGYHWYFSYEFKARKHERWHRTDKKLIELYEADRSKDKRYHYKKAGKTNFTYLRFDRIFIMQATNVIEDYKHGYDLKTRPFIYSPTPDGILELKISPNVEGKFTLWLSRDCYRNIKATIYEYLARRQPEKAIYTFNALNGVPCYSGINEQKTQMLREILKEAKRHNLKLKRDDFRINTYLKINKVFNEDDTSIKSL
jgi:hypothetical protein